MELAFLATAPIVAPLMSGKCVCHRKSVLVLFCLIIDHQGKR